MKKILLFIAIIVYKYSFSQTYTVSEKEVEIELTSNYALNATYLLEMNNGYTIMIGAKYKRENLFLKIFDQNHNEKISTIIKLENIKKMSYDVKFIKMLELNGKVNFFYLKNEYPVSKIYKLEIDPNTGEYKNEPLFEYTYFKNNLFSIIENDNKSKYALIFCSLENQQDVTINTHIFNSNSNKLIAKYHKILNDCYELELLDAVIDDENIYLCLNKKLKPAEPKSQGFFKDYIQFIPENKVSIDQININDKTCVSFKINLPPYNYHTKAQLNFDTKNNKLNLLLSVINPKDNYGRIPDVTTFFYKFSRSIFNLTTEKKMTNQLAIKTANHQYPKLKMDENVFANFPQYMFTDSLGNNAFLFETVYNYFNHTGSYFTFNASDFAFEFSNSEAEINSIIFAPYMNTINGLSFSNLGDFAFNCNRTTNPLLIFGTPSFNFTTFEVDNKIVIISNNHPENIDKALGDNYTKNTTKDLLKPMILIVNKNYYSKTKVFNEPMYNKLKFDISTSFYNKKTKIFCVAANETKGNKERLVWIKFQ